MTRWILAVSLVASVLGGALPSFAQAPEPSPTSPSDSPQPPAPGAESQPPTTTVAPQPLPVPPDTLPPVVGPTPPPPTIPGGPPGQILQPSPTAAAGPQFQIHPIIQLSEEYSDNFNLSATRKEENFRSQVTPGVDLAINGAFTRGAFRYLPSVTYDTSLDEVRLFHSFNGSVWWQATPRLRLTVFDVLISNDQASEADRLQLRVGRREFLTNTAGLSADYRIGNVDTRAHYSLSMFSNSQGNDSVTHGAGLSAAVPLYTANRLTVGYEFLHSETTGTSDSTTDGHTLNASFARQISQALTAGVTGSYGLRSTSGASSNDFNLWTVSAFTNYGGPHLTLSGSIGYSQVIPENGSARGSVFTLSTLAYRFARATVGVSVEQGFSETFASGENVGVVETRGLTAWLHYPVTARITTSAEAFYRENETTGLGGGDGTQGAREVFGGTVGLSVRLLRNVDLALEYRYTDRTTTFGDIVENRGRMILGATF